MNFDLNQEARAVLFQQAIEQLETFYENTKSLSISPSLDTEEIRAYIFQTDFNQTEPFQQAVEHVIEGLTKYSVHTPHPNYFGLFNPRSNFPGILADLITATLNPQLAAWSHAPFAAEVEARLIQEFGEKCGYSSESVDGVFTTGGAEANITAVLCALNHHFPDHAKEGLIGLDQRPLIYCSEEAHHSINKASKAVGLGYASVKSIPVKEDLRMDPKALEDQIQEDLKSNGKPFLLVGTAGTTGAGTIDDLPVLKGIAEKFNLWFHVDAAYGGAAILHPGLKEELKGIESSDSITFDAHKWLSVPMGTSLFITSKPAILGKTFRITTEYMPKEANELAIVDPFTHSIQWSRRFIGLKLYLSLMFFGWKGYEEVIGHQAKMGDLLREKLKEHGWSIKNETNLPVVCFTDDAFQNDEDFAPKVLQNIIAAGNSWLSVYPINQIPTFRACITNYNTTEQELDELIKELNEQRLAYRN